MRPSSLAALCSLFRAAACTALLAASLLTAEPDKTAAKPAPDTIVLSNGDTLHGKFTRAIEGKVFFHSDVLGDLTLSWDQVKELHTAGAYAVLDKSTRLRGRRSQGAIPSGAINVADQQVSIQVQGVPAPPPIPTKDTRLILDLPSLETNIRHQPGIFSAWQGAATAGGTVITATQNQYTVSGGINLVRSIPAVDWLNPRNRTLLGFTGSFGKITQPSYTDTTGAFVPAVTTKSALYHAGAERDEYVSTRFYLLGQAAFDHNYSQNLDLQQIYGGGLGWSVIKTPHHAADLKATVQYEKQTFLTTSNENQNLFGSTFAATYVLSIPLLTFTQNLSYLPAWNNTRAYSATESNTIVFPAYKNLGFTVGTTDSYLNNPPASEPPTERNSFQFTMGLTYAIHTHP